MYEIAVLGNLGTFWGSVKIKTTFATSEKDVNEVIQAMMSNSLNRNRLIGLDMIPIRSTTGKTRYAILQLCDSTQCLIVRIHSSSDLPLSLYNFLILPSFTFAGFGIKDTIASLKKDYAIVCKNVLEVGTAMWSSVEYNCQFLSEPFQNMRILHICNIAEPWGSNFYLTEDEIKLAVSNAFHAFRIAKTMLKF